MDFATLLAARAWRPIPGCPGRYVLIGGPTAQTPSAIADTTAQIEAVKVPSARDPVAVLAVEGGGLISYRQADGRWIHTLNTAEGLARKRAELGV